MTTFTVDQALFDVIPRDIVDHAWVQAQDFVQNLNKGAQAIKKVRMYPFPNAQTPSTVVVAVTIDSKNTPDAVDALTYESSLPITGIGNSSLFEHIQTTAWNCWHTRTRMMVMTKTLDELIQLRMLDRGEEKMKVSNVAPDEPPLKLQLDESGPPFLSDRPTCPLCGHIAVNQNGFWKCLNCGESLGRVDGKKDDDLPVPAATIPCPECGKTMEHVGAFQKCPACRYSTGPS